MSFSALHALFDTPCMVTNYRDGRQYRLMPLDTRLPMKDAGAVERIVEICNQPHVFGLLFAERRGNVPYTAEDAAGFLAWGRDGWEQGTHFVFLIVDTEARVAGAIDIKSGDLEAGEIGYWLRAEDSGVMTGAVQALALKAGEAGYRLLYGLVRPENIRSSAVLLRAGFQPAGRQERDGRTFDRYSRQLH